MKFTPVTLAATKFENDSTEYRKIKDFSKGEVIVEGLFKSRYESNTFSTPSYTYYFETADGSVGVNSCGALNLHYTQGSIKEGEYFQIIADGKKIIKNKTHILGQQF